MNHRFKRKYNNEDSFEGKLKNRLSSFEGSNKSEPFAKDHAMNINKRKLDQDLTKHIFNTREYEMNEIAKDLNRIYYHKYRDAPFSVEPETIKLRAKDGTYKNCKVFILVGSPFFDWNKSRYTKMLREVMDASVNINADIVADRGPEQESVTDGVKYHGLLVLRGGGYTVNRNLIYLSNALSPFNSTNKANFSLGGVFLHEMLGHVHPDRAGTWALQDHYNLKRSTDDHVSKLKDSNPNIRDSNLNIIRD